MVRALVASIDPDLPFSDVATMKEPVDASMSTRRVIFVLLGLSSVLALTLAGIGIYGRHVLLVAQRTNEFGIRAALGARPRDVVKTIVAQGLAIAALGIVVGVAVALGVTRLMSTLLSGSAPWIRRRFSSWSGRRVPGRPRVCDPGLARLARESKHRAADELRSTLEVQQELRVDGFTCAGCPRRARAARRCCRGGGRPEPAETARLDPERHAPRRPLGEQSAPQRVVDDVTKRTAGLAGRSLQLGGDVIVEGQGGAHILMLPATAFAVKLAQEPLPAVEMVIEDAAGDVEQRADERVAQGIAHGQPFLPCGDDALVSEHGQLLRDERLVERQGRLQFLDGALPAHEDLEDPDPRRVRQRTEELGLEGLELAGDHLFRVRPRPLAWHEGTIF